MITRIEIEGFKSLQKVALDLGHLNLFIGTNASGKSNFFDALRVLQGIGYGFTVDEIFNGKPKSAGSEVWEPIRGGSEKAAYIHIKENFSDNQDQVIKFHVELLIAREMKDKEGQKMAEYPPWKIDYSIGISPRSECVMSEKFVLNSIPIYDSEGINNTSNSSSFKVNYFNDEAAEDRQQLEFEKTRPVLCQIHEKIRIYLKHEEAFHKCINSLSNMQRIEPIPTKLREYSQTPNAKRMGEQGENFAALVNTILANKRLKSGYLSWLQELTPAEFEDVIILKGAKKEPLFALRENGIDYPGEILSDGTLRFAAITAAFFQPDMPDVMTIEEIENGIHPSRLRLLVELLKSQSQNQQVMATTHSPIVLAWLQEPDFKTTFFCKRDEETGASLITPLDQVPRFMDLVKKQSVIDLFTEGWLEGAL